MERTWVMGFDQGRASQRDLLGGKGANLAEMTNLGLPVPPGFTDHDRRLPGLPARPATSQRGLWDEVERGARPMSKRGSAGASAIRTIRCCSRSAPARSSRCRA